MKRQKPRFSRREVMATGAALPFVVARPGAALAAAVSPKAPHEKPAPPKAPAADYTLRISEESIAPLGKATNATLVNGVLPGPEIRYREGDMFRVLVENALQVPTTVHWHGLLVPNYMDGVPEVTQLPIAPRESVLYEYPLLQNGTYWYHSHYRFQEQTGLSGPFIIDARHEPYAYDREAVVFLADWLNQSPDGIIPQIRGEQKMTPAAQPVPPGGYPFPGKDPFAVDLNYPGYLMNGQSNEKPFTLEARKGDRIRFRLINGSTSSFFQVSLDDHELELIAADGQPVDPVRGKSLVIATAERYDFLVTLKRSGSFTLRAAALGTHGQVVGIVHTPDVAPKADTGRAVFEGPSLGVANYRALRSPYPTTLPDGPVQTFDIELGGLMKRYLWSMAGEYYPEPFVPEGNASPLRIREGQRVRVRFTNSTKMFHPMHLHGHFFRLLPKPGSWDDATAPLKDTVGVGPGEKVDIEFLADNPGSWFFHCHNLYHLAAGMARVVRYEV